MVPYSSAPPWPMYSVGCRAGSSSGLTSVATHGVFIGEAVHVEFDDELLTSDGGPIIGLRPLMRVTGNLFTTAGAMPKA
jgi:hypothetical protein